MARPEALDLQLEDLTAGYGELQILHGLSFAAEPGEAICIIGRNGMGKTTLLSSIAGRTRIAGGRIVAGGASLRDQTRVALSRMGIGLVPQEREVFANLTVEENLKVADQKGSWTMADVYALFPRLTERRSNLGSRLSGGEQQMLSVARALMGSPRLLLLDEPSEGLAPVIVDQLFEALLEVRQTQSMTMLLVEQHVRRGLDFCPRVIGLRNGRIVYDGASSVLLEDDTQLDAIMGLQP